MRGRSPFTRSTKRRTGWRRPAGTWNSYSAMWRRTSRVDRRAAIAPPDLLPTHSQSELNLPAGVGKTHRAQNAAAAADRIRRPRVIQDVERIHVEADIESLADPDVFHQAG